MVSLPTRYTSITKPIYQATPGNGPYSLTQILKLYPPMDVSVSKSGTL
jgi:hypothetical protein